MKEDELAKYLKTATEQIAKHAEVINTLNKNQQVIVKKLQEYDKTNEINKRVQEIVKQTENSTTAAEAKEEIKKVEEKSIEQKPAEEKPAETSTEEKKEE